MTPLEALDKINTMFLAYAPRDIREDKELNEDLFGCIETALKRLEEQDNIVKIIKEIIAFDKTLPDIKVDENNALSITSGLAMRFQREIENKERKLFRDWILKECFPKEMKAFEIIKKKRVNVRVIFHTTNVTEYNEKIRQYYDCLPLTQEEYELLKEIFNEKD